MKRRRLLLFLLVSAAGSLAALAVWFLWPWGQGQPDAEALVGKWVREDAEKSDFTITFYRSGECELSITLNAETGKPERFRASGVWELQGQTLILKLDSSNSGPSEEVRWQISLSGNKLTYKRIGGLTAKRFTLLRTAPEPGQSLDSPTPPSFVGPSRRLHRTVVVPTLQTRLPSGKSVVWCATLALAWQQLQKKVGNGPVLIQGYEEVARAWSRQPDVGLPAKDYYVAAGSDGAGLRDRIRQELRERFPRAPFPDLPPEGPNRFLTYAHLEASVRYAFAFRDSGQPLRFKDSQGRITSVRAFGIREQDEDLGKESFRGQVRVLFREGKDFAVDLSRKTRPYQIILARMPRQATFQETLADFEKRVARAARKRQAVELGDGAILLIPNMNWRIEHRFRELENKRIRHPALPPESILDTAFQLVQFKMDRRGTELVSEGIGGGWLDGAEKEDFRFDQPYLILLRKRDFREPFFVMWVDNAELLQRR